MAGLGGVCALGDMFTREPLLGDSPCTSAQHDVCLQTALTTMASSATLDSQVCRL